MYISPLQGGWEANLNVSQSFAKVMEGYSK